MALPSVFMGRFPFQAPVPPSTGTYAPVMKEDASEVRNAITDAISSGGAGRPSGVFSIILARLSGIARLLGMPFIPMIDGALHSSAPGARTGWVHSDYCSAWFHQGRTHGDLLFPDRSQCEYFSGRLKAEGAVPRRYVRGATMIYYLANDGWAPGDGGETELLAASREFPDGPVRRVTPLNNRLLIFPMPLLNEAAQDPSADLPLTGRIVLDTPVTKVQGCVFRTATRLLCSSDDTAGTLGGVVKPLLQIDLAHEVTGGDVAGRVTVLGPLPLRSVCSADPSGYEAEGLDYDHRGVGFKTGVERGFPPVFVLLADHLRVGFLRILERVVNDAERAALTRDRSTHASRPQPAALRCLPLLDACRALG